MSARDKFWRAHDDMELIGPRTDRDFRRSKVYKLDVYVLMNIIELLFENALRTSKKPDGGLMDAYSELDRVCQTNREFKTVCRKSDEEFHSMTKLETGPAFLRNRLFYDVFEHVFGREFPLLAKEVDSIYGRPTGRELEISEAFLPWEQFFRDAYLTWQVLKRDLRERFNRPANDPTELVIRRFTADYHEDDLFYFHKSLHFAQIYAILLHSYGTLFNIRFPIRGILPRHKAETLTGAQFARRVLQVMLQYGTPISELVSFNGMLYDGSTVYAAVIEEGGRFDRLVSGGETYGQVRAAFYQSPDKRIWVPFLDMVVEVAGWEAPRADRIQVSTYLFLLHRLADAGLISNTRTTELVESYINFAHTNRRHTGHTEDDDWAVNVFFSRSDLDVEGVRHAVQRAHNLENVKAIYSHNNSSLLWRQVFTLWRQVFDDKERQFQFNGLVWLLRQLWEKHELPVDELRQTNWYILKKDTNGFGHYYTDYYSGEHEWLDEIRRTALGFNERSGEYEWFDETHRRRTLLTNE